mmetsp:Transcript_11545/g.13965  ORF Transcript_11545/g.13965 Transcript_11545/m.13965 type:complete len:215 (+) Transcript_11545:91-735(+)
MCGNTFQHFKVGRECLGCATGVMNNHIHSSACCQTKGHGHSVIIVCFDQDIVVHFVVFRRVNDTVVTELFHGGSKLGTFGHNGLHAFCFLQSPRIDIPNGGGSLGKECRDSQSHGSIGNLITIHIHTLEFGRRITSYRNAIGSPRDSRSHLFHHIGKGHISLDTFGTTSSYRDSTPGNGGTCNKVTGGTCISFDENRFRTGVFLSRGNVEGRCP